MSVAAQSAALGITRGFTAAERMKIQEQACRDKNYIIVGRMTAVLFEGQREISGHSQSRARYTAPGQEKQLSDALKPFSESQTKLWYSVCLDWLTHKNAPILAISRDHNDLLLPNGLPPLPPIPDPRWVPKNATDKVPRIPQLLTGCPVVGDRITDKITDRTGRVYGVVHPVIELCVMLGGAQGGFARIRGGVDPADGTHLALLLDDSNPNEMRGYFVGGRFQLGG
jgi:hypothetical protein